MTNSDGGTKDPRARWHDVLLSLAGWLSDDVLTSARDCLAAGREDDVARSIAQAIETGLVPFTAADAARLRDLLVAHADPASVDAGVRADPGCPPFTFLPVPPWGIGPEGADDADDAAVAAAAGSGAAGLWRVWRYPPHDLQPAGRVYLVEAAAEHDLPAVAGRLQEALRLAGEPAPQVEVFASGSALPEYHREALAMAESLWSPDPAHR